MSEKRDIPEERSAPLERDVKSLMLFYQHQAPTELQDHKPGGGHKIAAAHIANCLKNSIAHSFRRNEMLVKSNNPRKFRSSGAGC